MTLDDIVVILCRPSESGNIGAVCRALKNMGLKRLRIVAPERAVDDAVVRARCVHAEDVWDGAESFPGLAEALADCSISVATTRRRGKKRKDLTLPPEDLAALLASRPGPAAVVFGNERTGLSEEEVDLCDLASHVPADDAFPSLNLSHAVQVYAYALYRALGPAEPDRWVPADRSRLDELVRAMTDSLESIGFYTQAGRPAQERFFRGLLSRAAVTLDETRYLEKIFRKMARLAAGGRGGGPDR